MTREYLYCDCSEPFHNVVFDWDADEESLLIYHAMKPYLPWYRRVLVATNYILGRDTSRIQYTEVVLDKGFAHNPSVRRIRNMLNKVLGE